VHFQLHVSVAYTTQFNIYGIHWLQYR